MQIFKGQPGWTHVFGPNYNPNRQTHPYSRQPIHHGWNWPKLRNGLKGLAVEYCSHGTIHGVSYIGSRRSLLERFWWLAVVVLSMYCCGRLIENVYHKWESSPVILSFDERPTSVWDVPFPAVTVCPESKIIAENMNFTDYFHRFAHRQIHEKELDQQSLDQLMAVLPICDRFFARPIFAKKYANVITKNNDVVSLLKKVSINATESFFLCTMIDYSCTKMFMTTITEEGICFTFNGFSSQDMFNDGVLHSEYEYLSEKKLAANWTLEDGYAAGSAYNSHPIRVLGSGYGAGLTTLLVTQIDNIEHYCRAEQGFKVVLHPPNEYPRVSKNFILATLDRHVSIKVHPQIIKTSKNLRKYSPDRRQCYFSNERQLRFFRVYSQSNCELECLTNFTLEMCGCVKFSMPRSAGTRICGMPDMSCVLTSEMELVEQSAEQRMLNRKTSGMACNCMQACSSIHYATEITQSTYNYSKTVAVRLEPIVGRLVHKFALLRMVKLGIYFKEAQFISAKRSELYGLTDFIANCGGILGLCLGISFFSLVELLYYCSVRPVLLVRKLMRKRSSVLMVKECAEDRY